VRSRNLQECKSRTQQTEPDRLLGHVSFPDASGTPGIVFAVQIRAADSQFLRNAAKDLFDAYDDFLGLLNEPNKRKHLDELKPEDEEADLVFKEARTIRKHFRLAIQGMFLDIDSPLRQHSIEKGVF